MSENPGLIPANVDVAEAQRDLAQLDALRPHIARLTKLIGRAEDSEMALEGYALLKVLGKGSGLDALRRDMPIRFTRKARATESPAQAA